MDKSDDAPVVHDMRCWLSGITWPDMRPEDFENLPESMVRAAVQAHYPGGTTAFTNELSGSPRGDHRTVPLTTVRHLVGEWVQRAEASERRMTYPATTARQKRYFAERAQNARGYAGTLEVVVKSAAGIQPTIGGSWE